MTTVRCSVGTPEKCRPEKRVSFELNGRGRWPVEFTNGLGLNDFAVRLEMAAREAKRLKKLSIL
jgi:hypothetical protein